MTDRKKLPGKNYKLISAQMRLNENQQQEELEDQKFDNRLKGFHLFCVIIFGAFIIDGQLPSVRYDSVIKGTRVLKTKVTEVTKTINGKPTQKTVVTPSLIQINCTEGSFITNEIKGYEKAGTKVEVLKTPVFKVNTHIYFNARDVYVTRWVNFSGKYIFWPLLAFGISLLCLVTKRFYGSTTLAVIALLNLVPFFTVAYLT